MTARTAVLSKGQLALLAEHGEERRAETGDVLFRVGDRRYPLIAIIEGEAAVLDQNGAEINRHGPLGFLGESNLLSGQTVFLTAVVTEPMRYIAVEREELRALLFEDTALSDLLLWTFMARREGLQARDGVGAEIVGPHSSEATRQLVEFATPRVSSGCGARGRHAGNTMAGRCDRRSLSARRERALQADRASTCSAWAR